jgi:hypothetical protein
MPDNIRGAQARPDRQQFEDELKAILTICENTGVLVRVLGSMAFHIHCPQYGHLQAAPGGSYGDIDLASYRAYSKQVGDVLTSLGYAENREIFVLSGSQRAMFYKGEGLRVDVFYEKLDFCHEISLKDRLHVDSPTIPLAELLLEIMQIVRLSEKDVINAIMLLLEHSLGEIEKETINVKLVARLCAEEWGLWRTTTINLGKVKHFAQQYERLTSEQRMKVESQVNELLLRLYSEPKSFAWKVRDQMGDRVKWYKDVDDV